MIEAELKARLSNPGAVRAALAARAAPTREIYQDTYYDTAGEDLDHTGRELRLRSVDSGEVRSHLLTFKEPAVDEVSGSKPEHESTVGAPRAVDHLLRSLGYHPIVELIKECENYRLSHLGRDFLATVVEVPEIVGTFLEVETMAEAHEVDKALAAALDLLGELGVTAGELTTELYTDAVRAARAAR
ncbi:adenylate cyclase class 2 [Krasilnikovia cinnamomea]|uniref:Adenylate cyclase class 2 n=1 Tax=Krasilnikovia cinnamomea TaxID=349313 RepID=A0A4Q7ZD76_9ACTN|nr:CYTH domain-containing protein [Krasilnikovia cinnamomea]RZU48637.1 adenylate cyclase class 2 [Krasilnikovia cinnamomea]